MRARLDVGRIARRAPVDLERRALRPAREPDAPALALERRADRRAPCRPATSRPRWRRRGSGADRWPRRQDPRARAPPPPRSPAASGWDRARRRRENRRARARRSPFSNSELPCDKSMRACASPANPRRRARATSPATAPTRERTEGRGASQLLDGRRVVRGLRRRRRRLRLGLACARRCDPCAARRCGSPSTAR